MIKVQTNCNGDHGESKERPLSKKKKMFSKYRKFSTYKFFSNFNIIELCLLLSTYVGI